MMNGKAHQFPQGELFRILIGRDANGKLRQPAHERTMDPIPERKDGRIIGICLAPNLGMMQSVHARGHDDPVEKSVDSVGKSNVRMMELGGSDHERFEQDPRERIHADEDDLCRPKWHGERQFSHVKPRSGAHVEVQVRVMDIVESPEKRQAVVPPVPEVKGVVHQQESCDNVERLAEMKPRQETEPVLMAPHGQGRQDSQESETSDKAADRCEQKIPENARRLGLGEVSQRKKAFHQETDQKAP